MEAFGCTLSLPVLSSSFCSLLGCREWPLFLAGKALQFKVDLIILDK